MDTDTQQSVSNASTAMPADTTSAVTTPTNPNNTLFYIIGAVVLIILGIGYYLFAGHGTPPTSNAPTTTQVSAAAGTSQQTTTVSSELQQNQSSLGYVVCTPVSSEFNCTVTSDPITHSYFSFSSNGARTFNGTYINLEITQNTGKNWSDVNVSFVPQGTPSSGGIPKFNFTSPGISSASVFDMYNKQFALALFIPVSIQKSGDFSGQLWAHYYVPGSSAPQYTLVGNVTVDAIAYVAPKIKTEISMLKGTCSSTYASYKCSDPILTLYENYTSNGQLVAFGNLILNLTETAQVPNTYISISTSQEGIPFCDNNNLPSLVVGHAEKLNLSAGSTCFIGQSNVTNTTQIGLYLFAYNNTNRTYESNHNIYVTVYPSVYPTKNAV